MGSSAGLREINGIKNAIHEGAIWELVEMRARAHPALLEALKILKKHKDYLEKFEPASRRGAFFYCGPESYDRTTVHRYQQRYFTRYRKPQTRVLIGFEETTKPYSRTLSNELKRISKKVDAMAILADVIQIQHERIIVLREREKKSLPFKFPDKSIEVMGDLVDKYMNLQIKLGTVDSKPQELRA